MMINKFIYIVAVCLAGYLSGCEESKPSAQTTATVVLEKLSLVRPEFMGTQPFELGGACNMENLNEKPWGSKVINVDRSVPFAISGWGADDKHGLAPSQVYLRLQNFKAEEFYASASIVSRLDLREYFGKTFYENSGYTVTVDAQTLPPGEYQAMIVMSVGRQTILCSSGTRLILDGEKS